MSRELDDDLLQRYYDGELSPVEERDVRARVEADPAAQARLKQLARLSEALQDTARQMGREVDADALFAGISAGIAKQEGRGAPGTLRVITSEWVEHRRHVWVPVAAAAAVAAAALLTVLSGRTPVDRPVAESTSPATQQQRPEATPAQPEQETAPVLARGDSAQPQGSHVEDVDFGSNTGTVFEIQTRGMTTAVVWIAEDLEEAP